MAGFEEMKAEALQRLKKLNLHPDVARYFDDTIEDTIEGIYYSERVKMLTATMGVLYWLSNEPEWENIVREVQEKYDIMVYHITHEYTEFGECLTMLYVSYDEGEWEYDNEDLDDGYAVAYVYNLSAPENSEFGSVGIKEAGGGLIRTA